MIKVQTHKKYLKMQTKLGWTRHSCVLCAKRRILLNFLTIYAILLIEKGVCR